MNKVPMTVAGEAALRAELDHLKKVERPRITQAIAEAREHGDLPVDARADRALGEARADLGRDGATADRLVELKHVSVRQGDARHG